MVYTFAILGENVLKGEIDMKKEEMISMCIRLSSEDYKCLERQLKLRNLDKTNYIRYLIRKDFDDLYSEKAANALNQISSSTENIMKKVSEESDIYSECIKLEKGVKQLWQCL